MTHTDHATGYEPILSRSPFIADMGCAMETKLIDRTTRLFRVLPGEGQANADGFLHGGYIASLADFTLSHGSFAENDRPPAITLSLNVTFCRAARPGDWIAVRVDTRKASASILFADATFEVDGKIIAHASGVFRPVRPPEDR